MRKSAKRHEHDDYHGSNEMKNCDDLLENLSELIKRLLYKKQLMRHREIFCSLHLELRLK